MNVLCHTVSELQEKVHKLETEKILNETQLPREILEENGLLPCKPKKLKRGRGSRPLLKSEILEAKKQSPFGAVQARWLGVHVTTYRKYAKMYGLYDPHRNEKGKRNLFDPNRGKYPLKDILEGKFPTVSDWMVKDKLIRSGTLKAECSICGYNKRRITDKKICLLLDHKDGDKTNFKIDNLQLLCFNCTFECGRGYIRTGKHIFDADWIQDAQTCQIDKLSRW
jgi:ribosomal protein L44E